MYYKEMNSISFKDFVQILYIVLCNYCTTCIIYRDKIKFKLNIGSLKSKKKQIVALIVDFTWCIFGLDGYIVVHCLLYAPVVRLFFGLMYLFCYAVLCVISSFAIILLTGEERAGCFTFVAFYVLCFCSRFSSSLLCYSLVCSV